MDEEPGLLQPAQYPDKHCDTLCCPGLSICLMQVLLTLGGYGTIAFIYNLEDELMPLYASAPLSVGGLALATSQLAVPLILGGLSVALFALWGYPRRACASALHSLQSVRTGSMC